MSNDSQQKLPASGEVVDFKTFTEECAVITDSVMDLIQAAMETPGKVSWMHVAGVAITMLTGNMTTPGVAPASMKWLHDRLLLLHDMTHAYFEGGADGVQKFMLDYASMLAEQENPPPGCPPTLH